MSENDLNKIFEIALNNHKKGNFKEAKIHYHNILKKNSNHLQSVFLLGTLLAQTKEFQNSIKLLKKTIQLSPNHIDAHNNLGNVYIELNSLEKALFYYQKAIIINPKYVESHYNIGNIFYKSGKYNEALLSFKKVIKINPKYAEAYNNLGVVFKQLNKLDEAMACYQEALKINSKNEQVYTNLGNIANEKGNCKEAINYFQKANKIKPDYLTSHWLSLNTFPIVYVSTEEIDFYRNRFSQNIKKINKLLDIKIDYTKDEILSALQSSTNFYLHYQGKDDLNLQTQYAQLIERLTKKIYPQFYKKRNNNITKRKIKIGFISSYFKKHSISKTHKNWIVKLNKTSFDTFVYYVGNKIDETTKLIKKHASYFFNHTNIDSLIDQISKDNLNILIFMDIGMNPKIQILASLRLAPMQCLAMGHPITSGFKNIDYALSSELMESKNAQKYYSEKLIKLPNTSQCYEKPIVNKIIDLSFTKDSNKTFFLNLQSLYKLLPQDDHIYLDIAIKYPNCQFWFIKEKNDHITSVFKNRIMKLFHKSHLSFKDYFVFFPRMSQNKFFKLINSADVILDSLNWSGNNSSHEAISLNKPIVTLPGTFMRGRHTYSILKKIDLQQTIANSKFQYVEIAIKLANDLSFRNCIIDKIKKNKKKLFNDKKPIKFLETFFKKRKINK